MCRHRASEGGGSDSDSTLVSEENLRRTSGSYSSGGGGAGAGAGGVGGACGGADTDGDTRSCGSVSDGDVTGGHVNGEASPAERRRSTRASPSSSSTDASSGALRHSSSYYTRRHVAPPEGVSDLDYKLLQSGIAILPGSSDLSGKRLIFIFTCSVLWHHRQVVSAELTRLLMYYFSIPRRELVTKGVTIVVDIRGATSSTVNILLESLYLFKDNVPNSISVIHILVDKPTQSLVLKSPVYDPQSGVSMDLLLSQENLQRSISLDQLPPALDGTFPYSHEEWVRFRMKLEPFLTNCCTVAQFLVGVMQEVSSSDLLPRSTCKIRELMTRHELQVKAAFTDPRLKAIQNDGEAIMSSLRRDESYCCHSQDYRHALEKVSSLYRQLQETMNRLATLAQARLQRLEQCLQARSFEEECDKVLTWLQKDGQALLQRHSTTADNLKAIRAQQRDFEKLYFSAMAQIERGNSLLQESETLAQTAPFNTEVTSELEHQLRLYASDLESTRNRIEGTARCYSELDRTYQWAVNTVQFLGALKLEQAATINSIQKLIQSLDGYLNVHPPIPDCTFQSLISSADGLDNERLSQQCRLAQLRCEETRQLLLARKDTLEKALRQLQKDLGPQDAFEAEPADLAPAPQDPQVERCCDEEAGESASCYVPPSSPVWRPATHSTSGPYAADPDQSYVKMPYLGAIGEVAGTSRMPEEEEDFLPNKMEQPSQTQWSPASVNSHLSQNSSAERSDKADGLHKPPPHRTAHLIIQELAQTERDYAEALNYTLRHYEPEMRRPDVPQALRGKGNIIFSNLKAITTFHSQCFLKALEACRSKPFLIGRCFLRHEQDFQLYALYTRNKPRCDELMAEHGKHFFQEKQIELGDQLDLASYLLKPIQRMGKYALLLGHFLKDCTEGSAEHAEVKAAEQMVRYQLRRGNDLLAMDSLRNCDVNLQEQGKLLRQDEFLVLRGRKKMVRQVFLFENLILFSKARQGRQGQHEIYTYKHSLKMADIGLTENVGECAKAFEIWFRRRSLGGNYIMQAPNLETKEAWVRDISRILWEQAIINRERRRNELSAMGIGNKPCLDLNNSSDNIVNRAVDIRSLSTGSRSRNSIAVSSVEYMRNGSKRPHSVISVGSNSSSSSSQSSMGILRDSMLNQALDLDTSCHHNRQSMLSSESGIEVDHSTSTPLNTSTRGGTPGTPTLPYSITPHGLYYMNSINTPSSPRESPVTDV